MLRSVDGEVDKLKKRILEPEFENRTLKDTFYDLMAR
jgi:hypothetical protein